MSPAQLLTRMKMKNETINGPKRCARLPVPTTPVVRFCRDSMINPTSMRKREFFGPEVTARFAQMANTMRSMVTRTLVNIELVTTNCPRWKIGSAEIDICIADIKNTHLCDVYSHCMGRTRVPQVVDFHAA